MATSCLRPAEQREPLESFFPKRTLRAGKDQVSGYTLPPQTDSQGVAVPPGGALKKNH